MRRVRYLVRTRLASHEWPYLALAGLKRNDGLGQTVVTRNTDLVIEAFPRSGNTFAVQAFLSSQQKPVRLAHHLHAPSQIKRATRYRVPALVILRNPKDAVLSFVIKEPVVCVADALQSWIRFYKTIAAIHGDFVISRFEDITADFGAIIKVVNDRFQRDFGVFVHTPDNVRKCFDAIDGRYRDRFGAGTIHEDQVGRPSTARARLKLQLEDEYRQLPDLTARAEALYLDLLSITVRN